MVNGSIGSAILFFTHVDSILEGSLMELIQNLLNGISDWIGEYVAPIQIGLLLGTGLFLTIRLGFVQLKRLKHGIEVTTGKFDDPNEPGDVSHFQALTTALSATVGVGNIAGVATAIHWGGPGALFWMWVTAFFGMAVKFSEVTLALKFRKVEEPGTGENALRGSVSGGPMYYIEKGLGTSWKPLAIFFAIGLLLTSFLTGNAIQANTLADQVDSKFGVSPYITGAISCVLVGIVIFGGIRRIGKVTSILAPTMAFLYVTGALIILAINYDQILPSFGIILKEAWNPTSGVAGTGAGALITTLMWGVKRGLFSNEAGQGSAPIAHAAAQTNEPVSEGVVALLEPFIDTLVICTITGLVIVSTGVWNAKHPTIFNLNSGDISFRMYDADGVNVESDPVPEIQIIDGVPQYEAGDSQFSWHEVPIDKFYLDVEKTRTFSGTLFPERELAIATDGQEYATLHGDAVETAAPLTSTAFGKHLGEIGEWIVLLCVVLFAVSTAISWSYYGDRCASYIFGNGAIIPYKALYLVFHYIGATASLQAIWNFGDTALTIVTIPNLIALLLLAAVVSRETRSYFEREPWNRDGDDD